MNQGFGLNYNSNFFMVRDSGHVPPGMDCLQLQLQPHQVRTQPFHYLINEQAKSLLALQELQNEVGALLEFRDLVMETFPNLRQKMSNSGSHNFSSPSNYCSNLPASLNSRHWEPGIKVKRKIVNKNDNDGSFGRVRSNSHGSKMQSSQPKSSEAISGVQDSGFSTETNSSNKDQGSGTATSVPQPDEAFLRTKDAGSQDEEMSEDGLVLKVNEAEEELWNLLDVIHTKGTKLREEVETLQLRLVVEEIENHLREKELEIKKVNRKFRRRCRSLDSLGDTVPSVNPDMDASFEMFSRKRTRSIELEDVDHIREERNMLLDKLAEMETENVANRIKTSELQNEITALINTKEELQEQLLQAMKQKNELNSRIHELHLKFVTGDRRSAKVPKGDKPPESDSSQSETSQKSSDDAKVTLVDSGRSRKYNLIRNLGALDGIVSNPRRLKKYCKLSELSRKKLEAILKEKNYLELQRHLLVSVVENQALNQQLETSIKSHGDLREQLDRYKKENDELLFQLEEKNIELEGTRAQVRVLEKLQHQSRPALENRQTSELSPTENFTFLENDHLRSKGFSESEINRARQIFLESQNKKTEKSNMAKTARSSQRISEIQNSFDLSKSSNVIPILALPLPGMSSHHSSETESTHALEISSELEADLARVEKSDRSPYRRRPSKIPLNIQKNGKSLAPKSLKSGMNCSPSLKKSDSELSKSRECTKKSLENSQNSIKYSSVGRASSQLSMASQKSHPSSKVDRRKSLTPSREDSSKQAVAAAATRQRKCPPDSADTRRTVRSSFRESFRSRISIDGNSMCSKRDSSMSTGRKDSLQLRQNRSGSSAQAKNNTNKPILSTESDNTKLECSPDAPNRTCHHPTDAEHSDQTLINSQPSSSKQDSDVYSDSLNQKQPEKYNLFREVRQNFQRRLAEKFSQTFSRKPPNNVWNCPRAEDDFVCDDTRQRSDTEFDFFDSIDDSFDVDEDDSLLVDSGYYRHKSANEATTEADSLEVRSQRLECSPTAFAENFAQFSHSAK